MILLINFGSYGQSEGNYFNGVADTENHEIIELVELDNNFSAFEELLEISGLDLQMEFSDPFTLIIPTNEAFKEMSIEDFNKLRDPQNLVKLQEFLRRHIIPQEVMLTEFDSDNIIETSDGKVIEVDADQDFQLVNIGGAEIIQSDIQASDGIIHVVDAVVNAEEGIR